MCLQRVSLCLSGREGGLRRLCGVNGAEAFGRDVRHDRSQGTERCFQRGERQTQQAPDVTKHLESLKTSSQSCAAEVNKGAGLTKHAH